MHGSQIKFSQIKILHLNQIVAHETHDHQRDLLLAKKIKQMNIFTNPVLVAHISGNTYMQIDGANRINAVRHLKIPCIPAQIVDYNDPEMVNVSSWSHIAALSKKPMLDSLSLIKKIHYSTAGYRYLRGRYMKDEGEGYLCTIVFRSTQIYRVATAGTLTNKIEKIREIVSIYKDNYKREMLPETADSVDVGQLFKKYPEYHSIVIFPVFTRHQIINAAVHEKVFLPSGITRFIIQGRYLDLNYPLEKLKSKKTLEEKNQELESFLAKKKTRRYEESTIYFEP